jgi:ferredoxin--NADP+ reductase
MTSPLGSTDNPLHVAIVGAGPAGFYAASALLRASDRTVTVDLYERLPTPWGLVRFGVAPDHPKIKSVSRVFERTARLPGFRFLGNVEVGRDVSAAELASAYHAVIYAVGAATDRTLGIPGEDLPGSVPATEFVAWYNGHPDYADRVYDFSQPRAIVVGNGNVALDVARMLALSPAELAGTDVATHALDQLRGSRIREIVVLGRRGPLQAAFTNPELRELADLELADVIVDPADLELDEAALADADTTARANFETLQGYAEQAPSGKPRRIVLRFLSSPLEITGNGKVQSLLVCRNALVADAGGTLRAERLPQQERLETGLVLRSVGYAGVPLAGIPFDASHRTILNELGRVLRPATQQPLPGAYTTGWSKRGPSGVIGTNKRCAQETVGLLFDDLDAGRLPAPARTPDTLIAELHARDVTIVDYGGWQAIDVHERELGAAGGQPRVKLVDRDELLAWATGKR